MMTRTKERVCHYVRKAREPLSLYLGRWGLPGTGSFGLTFACWFIGMILYLYLVGLIEEIGNGSIGRVDHFGAASGGE